MDSLLCLFNNAQNNEETALFSYFILKEQTIINDSYF